MLRDGVEGTKETLKGVLDEHNKSEQITERE